MNAENLVNRQTIAHLKQIIEDQQDHIDELGATPTGGFLEMRLADEEADAPFGGWAGETIVPGGSAAPPTCAGPD